MLLLWLACAGSEKEVDSAFPYDWKALDYRLAGPYSVGHFQVEHTYVPMSDQVERTIVIDVWYPTEETSGDVGEYLYGTDELVVEDADPAAPIYQQGYPVHVHSHGYQGWGASSAFLMRHFASHGWVGIAPNHTNNLLGDHQSPLPVSHFVHRSMDIQQSLDVAAGLQLQGTVSTDNVVMSGHSFGASYSTWGSAGAAYDNVDAVCQNGEGLEDSTMRCTDEEYQLLSSGELKEDRVSVAVPMAGTVREMWFGEQGYKSVHAPVLFVSGTEDGEERNQNHYDSIDDIEFSWLSLLGGCHQSFATGSCNTLDTELGFSIQRAYILAFARQRLLGDNTADIESMLSGQNQPWNEALLMVK